MRLYIYIDMFFIAMNIYASIKSIQDDLFVLTAIFLTFALCSLCNYNYDMKELYKDRDDKIKSIT